MRVSDGTDENGTASQARRHQEVHSRMNSPAGTLLWCGVALVTAAFLILAPILSMTGTKPHQDSVTTLRLSFLHMEQDEILTSLA